MEILKVCASAGSSFLVLLVMTRLNGKRQIAQLSAFDYINGITIGSIAAEMAFNADEFYKPLTALLIYALLTLLLSILTDKSLAVRHLVEGKPQILLEDGVFYRDSFHSGHIDLDEFLSRCRIAGYFKVSDIQMAVLEPNGEITFLPYERCRPATPSDLGCAPAPAAAPVPVISDGQILSSHLQTLHLSVAELEEKVAAEKQTVSDIFLATCDDTGALRIYASQAEKPADKL